MNARPCLRFSSFPGVLLMALLMMFTARAFGTPLFDAWCFTNAQARANLAAAAGAVGTVEDVRSDFGSSCTPSLAKAAGTVAVVADPTPDSGAVIHHFDQGAASSAMARALIGSLGGAVTASASSSPSAFFYTAGGAGAATDNNYQAAASAEFNASFFDTLTVMGPPSNPLAPVDLRFTLELTGGDNLFGRAGVSVWTTLAVSQNAPLGGLELTEAGLQNLDLSVHPALGPLTLRGFFDVDALAVAGRALTNSVPWNIWSPGDPSDLGSFHASSSATGGFASTAGYFIDILTPGASFASAAGALYGRGGGGPGQGPIPIDEPATAILVLLALALLTLRGRSRAFEVVGRS